MTNPKKTFTITRIITQTTEIEVFNEDNVRLILDIAPAAFAWQDHPELDKIKIKEKPQKG